MTREIGGYFGLERSCGREYHQDLVGVNSGRNALLYLLRGRNIRKLWIPRFLCDSVSRLCDREGILWEEYSIGRDFLPIFDRELQPGECLYIVNYYGQITDEQIVELRRRWGSILLDNVQAFFQRPVPGIDTIYSCRKFFGVPDGGYVASDVIFHRELEEDSSRERMAHILGRFEVSGNAYYAQFQANDESFYDMPLRAMSPITRNILRGVDYEWVRRRREENYSVLAAALYERNPLQLRMPCGPYCYPFYCENGMETRRRLAQQKIYVPTLWPNVLDGSGSIEREYARNILPLPCDQRYTKDDMEYMISRLYNVGELSIC